MKHLSGSFHRALLTLAACAAVATAQAQPRDGVPLMNPPLNAAPASAAARPAPPAVVGGYTTVNWEQLVPANWDPFKDFKGLDMASLNDGDPRAAQMLKQMRDAWDQAPTNPALVGKAVRIPGFVVPLEDSQDGLKEFLLVPYFGACIHSPPPPANQIIHVLPKTPAKGLRSMDAVWISGVLQTGRNDTYMGASGYRIDAQVVAPYQERAR